MITSDLKRRAIYEISILIFMSSSAGKLVCEIHLYKAF